MLFSYDFVYNRTFSPANPGILDFALFLLKYGIIGFAVAVVLLRFDVIGVGLLVFAAIIEEQALFTWIYNSERKLLAAIKFTMLLAHFEVVSKALLTYRVKDLAGFFSFYALRLPATLSHLGGGLVAYILVRNFQRSNYAMLASWIASVIMHTIWNLVISPIT